MPSFSAVIIAFFAFLSLHAPLMAAEAKLEPKATTSKQTGKLSPEAKSVISVDAHKPRITIFGTYDKRKDIPGSAHIVQKESLERHQYTDVHRAIREVPGVIVQEEDGFGLRPNIGIRGGRSNRSEDITLMEDGVLAAPAPYAAPAAYYFPQMERMESMEIIKGAGAIKHGPRTTNGVLNMVTKPVPDKFQADVIGEVGSHNARKAGATVGQRSENFGILVNAFHKESEGFKEIDFTNKDTGYKVQDIMAKFRVNSSPGEDIYQRFEFKVGNYDEHSDETYLGLTDADFKAKSNRRYAASQLDAMDVNALQLSGTHYMAFANDLDVTTTLYRNAVDRTWYRLQSVSGTSISSVFDNQIANAAQLATVQSGTTVGSPFTIRDNNRSYLAYGVQSVLGKGFYTGDVRHHAEIGLRYHEDEEDRFQREDKFNLTDGIATITSRGAPGSQANQIQSAQALSGFIEHEMEWGRWTFTPGVRIESINLKNENFGTADPTRNGLAKTTLENDLTVVIPGAGVKFNLETGWDILAGVHKGFAPPGVPATAGAAAFTDEEKSVNYEIGSRYANRKWTAEAFGFFTDYENLLGRDTVSSGGAGTGGAFNGGKVEVLGVEASLGYDAADLFGMSSRYNVPLKTNYTFLQGEFRNSFVSSFSEWGTVRSGDSLPYIPAHQLHFSAGLETPIWGISGSAKYIDEMRTVAGSGAIPANLRTDAHWVFDLAGEYAVTDKVRAFTTIENVFDAEYIAARRPAGVRPGLPLSVFGGIKIALGD
mgnify:CR=1 FL=1